MIAIFAGDTAMMVAGNLGEESTTKLQQVTYNIANLGQRNFTYQRLISDQSFLNT